MLIRGRIDDREVEGRIKNFRDKERRNKTTFSDTFLYDLMTAKIGVLDL